MSEQTRALLISLIRFDNAPQDCYDTVFLTDAIHNEDNQEGEASEIAEGHPKGLLRIRKCTCQGCLQMSPFFRTGRMGFSFDSQWESSTTKG